jgi:hypothetical protein
VKGGEEFELAMIEGEEGVGVGDFLLKGVRRQLGCDGG